MLRSIQFKFTAGFALAVLAGQLAVVFYMILFVFRPDPTEIQDRIRWWASYIQRDADAMGWQLVEGIPLNAVAKSTAERWNMPNNRGVQPRLRERLVLDVSQNVIVNTLSNGVNSLSPEEHSLIDRALRSNPPAAAQHVVDANASIAVPIRDSHQTVGVLFARNTQRSPWGLLIEFWQVRLVSAVLIAILFGLLLSYVLTRTLREVTEVASAISQGDLSRRVPVRSSDEVGRLAQEFNQMAEKLQSTISVLESERDKLIVALDRLQNSESRRRQLVADASHELRTPIACMQGTIEALLDEVIVSPNEKREALVGIHEDTLRLSRLVQDLLTVARVDVGEIVIRREPVPVSDLVSKTTTTFKSRADSLKIRLITSGNHSSNAVVVGDPDRLTQVLSNFLENALQHTSEGGVVRVETSQNNGHISIVVEDSGEGIPSEDLPFVFERFYRSDKSRCRKTGGTGLGLAIAREIVEAHGGTVRIESQMGQGTRVSVSLPASPLRDSQIVT